MDQNRIKRNQMLGAKIVKELTARNMEAYYTDSKEEALKKALELIPEGSSISWGGSMSVNEIGLKEAVCQGNYQVYNRDTAPTPEDKRKIELAAYDCDYFLTRNYDQYRRTFQPCILYRCRTTECVDDHRNE